MGKGTPSHPFHPYPHLRAGQPPEGASHAGEVPQEAGSRANPGGLLGVRAAVLASPQGQEAAEPRGGKTWG